MSRPSLPCPRSPCPRLLLIRSASGAANRSLHRDSLQVQLDRRFQLGGFCAALPPRGLRARESTVLLWRGAAAGWRRGWLTRRRGMHRTAGAGAGRLQVAASDARAGPLCGVLRGSRRCSGAAARRHGLSAPPVRDGAGSGASGAGAKPMPPETGGGRPGRSRPPCLGCVCVIWCVWCPEGVAPCVKVGLF